MAKMKDLYGMLQNGEYHEFKEAYELAEAEGVSKYLFKGNKITTIEAKYKIEFIELFLKSVKNDNIHNNNSIHQYFVQERYDK